MPSDKDLEKLARAEEAVRTAFDLIQLGASMLNKTETKRSETATNATSQSNKRTAQLKKKIAASKKVITFDSDSESNSDSTDFENEETTPEEDEDEDEEIHQTTIKQSKPEDDKAYLKYANDYISFTQENPTTFHVVEYFGKLLEANGFTYLSEKKDWSDLTAGLYYTTRNGTSLGAFALGKNWKPEYGAGIIGSHIDSLAIKLKPVSKKAKVDGYELLGVAPYAGALNYQRLDRDLGISGRVLVRVKDSKSITGFKVVSKLISSAPKPIARISSLAPHFGAAANPPFDTETQTIPVLSYSPGPDPTPTEAEKNSRLYGKHSLDLLRYIAELTEVSVEDLYQLDLDLFDVQPGTIGGLKDDFIYAPRIDDRICSFAALTSLLEFAEKPIPEGSFSQVMLYDNEEIGSLTRSGARSNLVNSITERVITALFKENVEALTRVSFANSIILSADVTHVLDPNYKSEFMENHSPLPNTGIAIATDVSNSHMATDHVGIAVAETIAKLNGDTLQYFHVKNNARSGGTIGPSIASLTGARTIDLGIAQLSMHSVRAAVGVKDVYLGTKFFKGFFTHWRGVYDSFGDL
ncbi:hypothetical protein WICPIJ_008123 [Wickerhamomyces pijperi]|uniref:Vacuolar aminopeptidase 1 n=1 Tax=Wickerhamomyces pijperi TaxID=599730 RepID=A0A9P8PYL6_WICPI|nr:hypothetical protein WICPIJ_008123 [Wickerhamomyces pijperi]